MRRRAPQRLLLGLLAAIAVLLALPASASAHAGDQSYVYLDVATSDMSGTVEFPFPDVEEVFGISLDGDRDEQGAAVDSVLPELIAYADEHFDIGLGGTIWTVTFDEEYRFLSDDFDVGVDYVRIFFDVELPVADVPQVFDVRWDPFFDEIEGRDALLLISNDWQRGVFDNEAESLESFDAGDRTATIDLGESSQWKNFTTSIDLGVNHIRTGPDHILFVFTLLLPSVLIWAMSAWHPVAKFGSSLWRVLKLVTMFTIAHSITFTLAGLDILPLPSSKLTETVIALSIAAAALNNIWPVAPNKEWVIAGGFGLFHGMGFAGLVSDLQVDRTTELVSLLGRNVGIEIGQAVVVLLCFPALFLLRRTFVYRPFFLISSGALAVVALGWMVERLFERDLGYNGAIDRVVAWPRALYLIAVVTALAALFNRFEASRGRLLPVWDPGSEQEADAGIEATADDLDEEASTLV